MIATAAYVLQKGYHAAHVDEYETSAWALVDLAIFMAFDLYMASLFAGVNLV